MSPVQALRAAAIDIGTNTVLCTIAERRGESVDALYDVARITRLGAGVDRRRELDPEACARTLGCLAEYRRLADEHGVAHIDAVGTSALRDVRSAERFLDDAERVLGTRPRVLSGEEEAELTFSGGVSGLSLTGEVCVFDVGGGSTELVVGELGEGSRSIERARSLDIGSVRLFERHVRSDPPSSAELALVLREIREALDGFAPCPSAELVGVAGTVMTLACMEHGTEIAQASRLHGARLGRATVDLLAAELARRALAERRVVGLDPGRADVIPVGALIVSEVLAWSGRESLIASDRGVRWGLLERSLKHDSC